MKTTLAFPGLMGLAAAAPVGSARTSPKAKTALAITAADKCPLMPRLRQRPPTAPTSLRPGLDTPPVLQPIFGPGRPFR